MKRFGFKSQAAVTFGMYHAEYGWRSMRGYLHVQEIALEIAWKSEWNFTMFNAPAIFHDRLAGLEVSIGLLCSYAGRFGSIQSQLNRLMNYTASLSVDPCVIGSMIWGVSEGLGAALEGAGHALECIFWCNCFWISYCS